MQQIRDLHHPVFSAKGRAPILEIGFRARSISPPLTPTTKELIRSIEYQNPARLTLIEVYPLGSTNYILIVEITAVLVCTQCKIENRPGLRRRLSFCPTQSHLQQANPIHRRSGLGFAIAALPLVVVDELIGDPGYGDQNTIDRLDRKFL